MSHVPLNNSQIRELLVEAAALNIRVPIEAVRYAQIQIQLADAIPGMPDAFPHEGPVADRMNKLWATMAHAKQKGVLDAPEVMNVIIEIIG